jgi:hypothetical protein
LPIPADMARWAAVDSVLTRLAVSELAEAADRGRDAWWCAVLATLVPLGFLVALFTTRVNIWVLLGGVVATGWLWTATASNARDARHARRDL